jgi:hypothetical protein
MSRRAFSEVVKEHARRFQSREVEGQDDFLYGFVRMQCVDAIQVGLGLDVQPDLARVLAREIRGALSLARECYATPWSFVPYDLKDRAVVESLAEYAAFARLSDDSEQVLSPNEVEQIAEYTRFHNNSGVSVFRKNADSRVVYAAFFGSLKTEDDARRWLEERYGELERAAAILESGKELTESGYDAVFAGAADSVFQMLMDFREQVIDISQTDPLAEEAPNFVGAAERVRRLCRGVRDLFIRKGIH